MELGDAFGIVPSVLLTNRAAVHSLGSHAPVLTLLSCLGRTARPGLAKEDVSSHGRNSQDEGAAEPPDGESSKVQ